MREVTITQYKKEFYPEECICTQTIRNWIQRGILQARKTPTGRWLIRVPEAANDPEFNSNPNAKKLLNLMNGVL